MNLHQRGAELINQLKEHVLEVLRSHPNAGSGGTGILQEEIARRAGLHSMGSGELDHTCSEILSLLQKENKIELSDVSEEERHRKLWRLRKE
ncbi:MAG: hypothetical protein AB7P17_15795 [Nitrospirales bacterium]|nr:hypothetical protein [Nitrospirales bacterium]